MGEWAHERELDLMRLAEGGPDGGGYCPECFAPDGMCECDYEEEQG